MKFFVMACLLSFGTSAHNVEYLIDNKDIDDLVKLGRLYAEKDESVFSKDKIKNVLKEIKKSTHNRAINLAVDEAMKKNVFDKKVTSLDTFSVIEKINVKRVERKEGQECLTKEEVARLLLKALEMPYRGQGPILPPHPETPKPRP